MAATVAPGSPSKLLSTASLARADHLLREPKRPAKLNTTYAVSALAGVGLGFEDLGATVDGTTFGIADATNQIMSPSSTSPLATTCAMVTRVVMKSLQEDAESTVATRPSSSIGGRLGTKLSSTSSVEVTATWWATRPPIIAFTSGLLTSTRLAMSATVWFCPGHTPGRFPV